MSNLHYVPHTPIEPAQVVSSAPAWDTLSSVANSFGNMAAKEAFSNKQAAIEANKYNLGADINQAATEAYIKAQDLNDAHASLKLYNGIMDDVGKKALAKALPSNKAYLRNLLMSHVNQGNLHFASQAHKVDQANTQAMLMTKLDSYANQATANGYNDNKPKALSFHANTLNIVNDMVKAGYSPQRAALYKENFNKSFYTNSILGEYKTAKTSGVGAGYKENFNKISADKYGSILGQNGIDNVKKQMAGIDKQFALQHGISKVNLAQKQKEMIYSASHGQSVDQNQLSDWASAFPESYKSFVPKLQDAHAEYVEFNSITQGSLQDMLEGTHGTIGGINANIANLTAEIPNIKNLREAQIQQNVLDRLIAHKNLLVGKNADPVGVFENDRAYQILYQQQKDMPGFSRADFNVAYGISKGLPDNKLSAIKQANAKFMVSHIEGINNPTEQGIAIAKTLDQFSNYSRPYAVKDLQRNGLSTTSQYMYRIYKDPWASQFIGEADIAFRTPLKDLLANLSGQGITKTNISQSMQDSSTYTTLMSVYQNMGGDTTAQTSALQKHTEALASQLILSGKATQDNAGEMAAQILTTGTKFDSFAGAEIFYPSSISSFTAHSAMSNLKDQAADGDIFIPPHLKAVSPGLTNNMYKHLFLSGAYYRVSGDQSGLELVTADQTPIKIAEKVKGKTVYKSVIIKYSDLTDANSDLNKSTNIYVKNIKERIIKYPTSGRGSLNLNVGGNLAITKYIAKTIAKKLHKPKAAASAAASLLGGLL